MRGAGDAKGGALNTKRAHQEDLPRTGRRIVSCEQLRFVCDLRYNNVTAGSRFGQSAGDSTFLLKDDDHIASGVFHRGCEHAKDRVKECDSLG